MNLEYEKQLLVNAWKAWLEHTGYSKDQWPLDYFINCWADDEWSSPGNWIKSWILATETVTFKTFNFSDIKNKRCHDCGQTRGRHLDNCWMMQL